MRVGNREATRVAGRMEQEAKKRTLGDKKKGRNLKSGRDEEDLGAPNRPWCVPFVAQVGSCSWIRISRTYCSWPFLHNFRLGELPRASVSSTDLLPFVLWKVWWGTKLQGIPDIPSSSQGPSRVNDYTWYLRKNSFRAQIKRVNREQFQIELVHSLATSYWHYPGARDPREMYTVLKIQFKNSQHLLRVVLQA